MNLAIRISTLFSLITCLTLLLSGTSLTTTLMRCIVVFFGLMILCYLAILMLRVFKTTEKETKQTPTQPTRTSN